MRLLARIWWGLGWLATFVAYGLSTSTSVMFTIAPQPFDAFVLPGLRAQREGARLVREVETYLRAGADAR